MDHSQGGVSLSPLDTPGPKARLPGWSCRIGQRESPANGTLIANQMSLYMFLSCRGSTATV